MGSSAVSTSLDESTTQYVTTAQDETNQEMGSSTVSTSLDESTTQYITTVQDETSQEIVLPTTSTSLDEFTTQYVQDGTTETKSGSSGDLDVTTTGMTVTEEVVSTPSEVNTPASSPVTTAEHTTMADLFNATKSVGSHDGAKKTPTKAPFLIVVLLVVIMVIL